ncbi:class I SAM-dependent methyltransferase [Pelagibius litoralis]|uniref:Class I SAM-dependent methyltransferase n=1 Tax=Pelagibius litoralis TaxID=374515 RepID=A0A967C239_9PROT|nr:class I SAM-dependent methyltransferase [Pelagibius litoralis]NIA67733.1 class I SAM-dependent methyltransferase [Pelagibius litoralis]
MDTPYGANSAQVEHWNGMTGRAWVDVQPVLDQMFAPLEDLLLETPAVAAGHRVLDVGCGTGSTTLAVARKVGEHGRCVGMDVSEPMIAAAQARADRAGLPAAFICADAQAYGFEPAGFDVIVSRLGVMFFDNPVRAFENLRHAAREKAALSFIAWRGPEENPFLTTPERASAPLLPDIPARRVGAPGPLAFAEEAVGRRVLQQSGWAEIEIRPVDLACSFLEKDLIHYFTRIGPLGQILQETDERTRAQVIETVRTAFDPYVKGAEVRFTAACWMAGARAPSRSTMPKGKGDA